MNNLSPANSWWQQWLFPHPPDHRCAPRIVVPGLIAHFFTGGVPVVHWIRDISWTGMYVKTAERWYPGTVVVMTLSDSIRPVHGHSITVNTRVVRSGSDGVGVQLLLETDRDLRLGRVPLIDGLVNSVNRRQFHQFLECVRTGRAEGRPPARSNGTPLANPVPLSGSRES